MLLLPFTHRLRCRISQLYLTPHIPVSEQKLLEGWEPLRTAYHFRLVKAFLAWRICNVQARRLTRPPKRSRISPSGVVLSEGMRRSICHSGRLGGHRIVRRLARWNSDRAP